MDNFDVAAGETFTFSTTWFKSHHRRIPEMLDVDARLEQTKHRWERWTSTSTYRGPYEDAVAGMPLFEENDRDTFRGIDIMRAVRSFDPCLPCGVHMYLGNGRTLKRTHSPMLGAGGGH